MKPSLFTWKNSWVLGFAILIGIVVPVITVLSHLNKDTWGGEVSIGGWIVNLAVSVSSIFISFQFYYNRWKFISLWRYTTKHGIQCFFEDGIKPYLYKDVEDITDATVAKWERYQDKEGIDRPEDHSNFLQGTVCIFKKDYIFDQEDMGFDTRMVYGISGWKWMAIGTGSKPIGDTAYMHECSHIYLNQWKDRVVPESEAHELFEKVGV